MSLPHPASARAWALASALATLAMLLAGMGDRAHAQTVPVFGTSGPDVIRLGYNSGTGEYWHQVNGAPAVNDGANVTSYSVMAYEDDDLISARGVPGFASSPLDIPMYARGGPGDDEIRGGDGTDLIQGEEDDDDLWGYDNTDILYGGDGDDRIWGGRDRDTISGGPGKDIIHGGAANDRPLNGDGGDDVVFGDQGADLLLGGNGADHVRGNAGLDILWGGADDDIVFGDRHQDQADGEGGTDRVYGNGSPDVVRGGAGDRDRCVGGSSTDTEVDGGPGLADICTECPPDNCLPDCEIQLPYRLPSAFSADPVRAVFDPTDAILALEADSIDVLTDGANLVQHVFDEGPCRDALLGKNLVLGPTPFMGQAGDLFMFGDIEFAVRRPDQSDLVSGTITNVTLDVTTGDFGGELDAVVIDAVFGSRMLELLNLAVAQGDLIRCTILNPGAAFELLASTGGFTMPGEAIGSYDMTYPNRGTPDNLLLEDCANGIDDNGNGCMDCEDSDCYEWPTCAELDCTNGEDDDGDGLIDCEDEDCVDDVVTCFEDCTNGIDDNGNGLIDCEDPSCESQALCVEYGNCSDGIDNDGDGLIDCSDAECRTDGQCAVDPALSTLCLVACPLADYASTVQVVATDGFPLAGVIVTLDLSVPIQAGLLLPTSQIPVDNTLSAPTDANGEATFWLPISGAVVDGVQVLIDLGSGPEELYASVPLAGFDLDRDGDVDEDDITVFETYRPTADPRGDYDCDGDVDDIDYDIAFGDGGHLGHQTVGVDEVTPVAGRTVLSVMPNPFQTGTTITYQVARSGPVRVRIYDVSGRLIVTLMDRKDAPAAGSVTWDSRSAGGDLVSPGVYFLHFDGPGVTRVRKMVISD